MSEAEFTEYQKQFMMNNAVKMTVETMAKKLKVGVKRVEDFCIENNLIGGEALAIRHKLRRTKSWLHLKDEFSSDELEYFEEKYAQYIAQFKEDIFVTEETQIFMLIKLEIMLHRNAKSKNSSAKEIVRLTQQRDNFLAGFSDPDDMEDKDRDYVLQLDTQIQAQKTAEAARSSEFLKLEEKHQSLMKDLKGTRDQRVTRAESSKESFLAIVRKLQKEDEREATGRHMALMKKVTERESERLSSIHEFIDGVEDLPILNADTITATPKNSDGSKKKQS